MTVTAAQFEALAPVSYAKAREDMRTGDIVLFHAHHLGARAIEYFTHSLWCHAGFVLVLNEIERVFIIESVDKIGVRMMPLSVKLNGTPSRPHPYPGKILLARHQDFPDGDTQRIGEMTRAALDRLGYPYSSRELRRIAERIALRIVGKMVPGSVDEEDAYICSEYVAMCFETLGIRIQPNADGFLAPGDIADDPKVFAVHALTSDPPPNPGP